MFKNKISLLTLAALIAFGCKSEHATSHQSSKIVEFSEQTLDKPNEFKSELFQKGILVYEDDFKGELNKEYLRSKKMYLENGTLVMAPQFKTKEAAMKKLKRDHHLGLGVVGHLNKLPEKFVLHMRYKVITDAIVTGRPSFQIGHHMMSLAYNKEGGYHLILPGEQKVRFSEPNAKMNINEWVDLVIEYQKGKMLLSVNGHSKVYEHEQVTIENKKDKSGPRLTFKSKEDTEERIVFDSIRLWEAE